MRLRIFLLLLLALTFTTQCSKPAELTKESAQRTIDTWAKNNSFTGQVTVQELEKSENVARVDLKYNNFNYTWQGQQRSFSDIGYAQFSHEHNGRWILREVHLFQISSGYWPAFKTEIEVK